MMLWEEYIFLRGFIGLKEAEFELKVSLAQGTDQRQ